MSWHTTYGTISIQEQCLRLGRRGVQVRAFCQRAQIRPRGYSRPLQRALVDFGADESFVKAARKVREHYGVKVPVEAARRHTLAHARVIGAVKHQRAAAAGMVFSGLDGSMVPIVESGEGEDRRKGKTLLWRQANLCCARAKGTVECVYGATMASVKMAGLVWREAAERAGLAAASSLHAVADGAEAIFNAFGEQFGEWGERAKFTVDYYHVSEYLSEAAEAIAPGAKKEWLRQQQGLLLENKAAEVLRALEGHMKPPEQEPEPARAAHQYIQKRQDHLDYAGARARELPIGSGEIESGHRHVIQERLKKSGSWWRLKNAEAMLQLRTVRANQDWDRYWNEFAKN